MNLDFRKLGLEDRRKALLNLLSENNGDYDDNVTFLAYLLGKSDFDVYGWFKIYKSNEGAEYWVNLKNEQLKSK